jgi:hypothetical protein
MSRTYALDLSLSYHTPAANVITPTISLSIPVQFTSQTKYAESLKSSLGVTVTQEELDEFFQPRNVTSPVNFTDNPARDVVVDVDLAPPEYSERIGARASRTVRAAT